MYLPLLNMPDNFPWCMNIFIPVMGKQNSLYLNFSGGMNGILRVFKVSPGNWIDLHKTQ